MIDLFLYFILYSFLGWIYESVYCSIQSRKLINRGFLNGPYIPIYGFGALLAVLLFHGRAIAWPLIILLSMLLASLLEYLTSYLLEKIFNARWWDYSEERFNINGRVYLLGAVVFGLMSLLAVKWLHPLMLQTFQRISPTVRIVLFWIFLITFLFDAFITVFRLLELKQKIDEANEAFNRFRAAAGKKVSGITSGLYDRFEDSEYYPERLRSFMNASHYQVKRILKAFPGFRLIKPSAFWEKLKKTVYNKQNQNKS